MRTSTLVIILLLPAFAFPPAAESNAVPISEGAAIAADGTRIYYRIAGKGPDVVLAPFALLHVSQLDTLASMKRRIVTYDPRGRGRSATVPPEKVSLDLLLSDLDAVRKAVGAQKVSIIGWSGAGMEMFVYALRNPARVVRLIQLAPVGPNASFEAMMSDRERRTDQAARAKLRADVQSGAYESRDAELCRAQAKVEWPATLADPARFKDLPDVCMHSNEWNSNLGPYFEALLGSFGQYDWRPDIRKVTIPRLVIHGAKDNIPLESSQDWVRGARSARLLVIEDSGHWPHYEQPQKTLPAMAKFLDGEWPPEAKAVER
jgi:pimeloyl-ACP methyl ester carboxylesterase